MNKKLDLIILYLFLGLPVWIALIYWDGTILFIQRAVLNIFRYNFYEALFYEALLEILRFIMLLLAAAYPAVYILSFVLSFKDKSRGFTVKAFYPLFHILLIALLFIISSALSYIFAVFGPVASVLNGSR